MSAGAAGDWSLFEGCISGRDLAIQRRPYHKNCKCALHKERGHCSHSSKYNTVCYPIRRTWSEGCLSLMNLSNSATSTPQSSPTLADIARTHTHLVLCNEEDVDLD